MPHITLKPGDFIEASQMKEIYQFDVGDLRDAAVFIFRDHFTDRFCIFKADKSVGARARLVEFLADRASKSWPGKADKDGKHAKGGTKGCSVTLVAAKPKSNRVFKAFVRTLEDGKLRFERFRHKKKRPLIIVRAREALRFSALYAPEDSASIESGAAHRQVDLHARRSVRKVRDLIGFGRAARHDKRARHFTGRSVKGGLQGSDLRQAA